MNTLQRKQAPTCPEGGYSILELIITVLVLGLFTTIGISAISHRTETVEEIHLRQQIRSLNVAAQTFELSGGDLSNLHTPLHVIMRLKSAALVQQKEKVAGFASSVVDPRLHPVSLPPSQESSGKARAIWDSERKRFVYATSGGNAVERFILIDAAVPEEEPTSSRKLSTEYASTDTWVWQYTDLAPSEGPGSNDVGQGSSQLSDIPSSSADPVPASQLLPPQFSVPGGLWDYPSFSDLVLEITNPNDSAPSVVLVSVNGSAYQVYEGPIQLAPDTEVSAFTQSLDPVSYTDSFLESQSYEPIPQVFEGTAMGNFTAPEGGSNMEWTISSDPTSSTFEWGIGYQDSDPSRLTFSGAEFSTSSGGDLFRLGTLDYFNGTIYGGTGAEQVDLQLEISFTVPETEESFTFDLGLENTPNNGVDADADADFVRIETPQSEFSTMLNGVLYALELQFGTVNENGFSSVDEFHVHEGSTATADVFGIFVAIDTEAPATP